MVYGIWYMVYMGYKVYNIWGIWYTHQIRSSNLRTTLCARTPKICCTGCPWRVPYCLSTSESQSLASMFQETYMIKLNSPEGVGRSIETVSFSPNEAELLPPYTAMVLKKKTSSELEYDVLSRTQLREARSTVHVAGKPALLILPIPSGPVCKVVPSPKHMRMLGKSGSDSFQ